MSTIQELIEEYELVIKSWEWYGTITNPPSRSIERNLDQIVSDLNEQEWEIYRKFCDLGVMDVEDEEQNHKLNEISDDPKLMREWLEEFKKKIQV